MDLSTGGARFGALNPITVGEYLVLSLEIPTATVECKARVCWTDLAPDGLHYFGVQFVDLSDSEREAVEQFTSQNLAMERMG